MDLETMFKECDIVSNHMANVPATVGMMNGAHVASMKPYATLINTGRGAQFVEDEMAEALKERPDITALLDVTTVEPLPEDSLLYKLDNVFLTPHIAGSQGNEVKRMSDLIVDELERFLKGERCLYEITPEKLKNMA